MQLGLSIQTCQNELGLEGETKDSIWATWDAMCHTSLTFSDIEFHQYQLLYTVLNREPKDTSLDKFSFAKTNSQSNESEKMYNEIRGFFRPHLSTAFLPDQIASNVWVVTGKPIKRVETKNSFGVGFPDSLFSIFQQYDFSNVKNEEVEFLSTIIADSFIRILFMSNNKKRRERLALRTAAWDYLPMFAVYTFTRRPV